MKNIEKTTVKIADFKAHLSEYLRNVRNGHPLTLVDRHTPVAQVVPYSDKSGTRLVFKPATLKPEQIQFPPRLKKKIDVLRYLAEERQSWR
jgi:prevent-host-death family protein